MLSIIRSRWLLKRSSCTVRLYRNIAASNSTQLKPTILEIHNQPPPTNQILETQGHVKSIRKFKKVGFLDINDGSIYQGLNIVLKDPNSQSLPELKVGQSIKVKGDWIESKGKQSYELIYDDKNPKHELTIVGDVASDYPLQKKETTMQNLRLYPSLRHRTSTLSSFLRLRSFLETKFMEFFNSKSFTKVTPPIITSSDCEGAGEVFKVEPVVNKGGDDGKETEKFFGKDAYLTVSTQLHLEALTIGLNRAWTLTPCFRAENSNTSRHLCEFWMLEAEICYIDDLKQLTNFTEDMVRYVTEALVEGTGAITTKFESGNGNDLLGASYGTVNEIIKKRWDALLTSDRWPSMTYTEAVEYLNKNHLPSVEQLTWGESLQLKHEKLLAKESPIFITDYPSSLKPFYMLKSKDCDPTKPTVACFDLLIPDFGELAGGSLREHDYDTLVRDMKRYNMNIEDMEWYLTLRKNGTVPHGGFGLGFERLMIYLVGHENVKDIAAFPRAPQVCSC